MKLCSSYRDRWRLIDRLCSAAAVVPCGHKLRHRLARNSLWRRKPAAAEARNRSRQSRWSSTSKWSKCFEWFQCRRRHHDVHQPRQPWVATLTVPQRLSTNVGWFETACDVPVGVEVAAMVREFVSSAWCPFCVDHYFVKIFLSNFVISAACLDTRPQTWLPSSMSLEWLSELKMI